MLIVFRRNYVKPESHATAKHGTNSRSIPINSLSDFLEELNECAEAAFGDNAQDMIRNLLDAKLPRHLNFYLNVVYLENGRYEHIVAHLERELELMGLEKDGELTTPTMTAVPPNDNQQNTEQPKNVCQYCKKNQVTFLEIAVKI